MRSINKLITFLILIPVFIACENEDIEYDFYHINYQSIISYPDGAEFPVSTFSFTSEGTYRMGITVYPSAVGTGDPYRYFTSIAGEYDYTREGNKIRIELRNDAKLIYGAMRDELHKETSALSTIFPTRFDLVIDRKGDKVNDQITSITHSTGIRISN